MWVTLLMVFCGFVDTQSGPSVDFAPCAKDDNACITKISNILYKPSVIGIPSLNIESLDPMFHEKIDGNLSGIKYKVSNTHFEGFKDCNIIDSVLSLEKHTMRFVYDCPHLKMYGEYEIDGTLVTFPIQGKGDYTIDFKDYRIVIDTDFKVSEKVDKKYLSFKSFTANGDLRGGMITDFKNLFNGQKELADNAMKFINENWKPISVVLQGPILDENVRKLIKNFNKYLKTKPIDTLIIL